MEPMSLVVVMKCDDDPNLVGRRGFVVKSIEYDSIAPAVSTIMFTDGTKINMLDSCIRKVGVRFMSSNKRITRNGYFMEVAKLTARRSTCLSRQVGAVVVFDNRIVGVGYNGPPSGMQHCGQCVREESGKNLDACPAIHAEINAVQESLRSMGRTSLSGAVLYATTQPCTFCLKSIINCNIRNIVYLQSYNTDEVRDYLIKENHIVETQFTED